MTKDIEKDKKKHPSVVSGVDKKTIEEMRQVSLTFQTKLAEELDGIETLEIPKAKTDKIIGKVDNVKSQFAMRKRTTIAEGTLESLGISAEIYAEKILPLKEKEKIHTSHIYNVKELTEMLLSCDNITFFTSQNDITDFLYCFSTTKDRKLSIFFNFVSSTSVINNFSFSLVNNNKELIVGDVEIELKKLVKELFLSFLRIKVSRQAPENYTTLDNILSTLERPSIFKKIGNFFFGDVDKNKLIMDNNFNLMIPKSDIIVSLKKVGEL